MAQVHPSRMALVPGGNAPRPPLPPQESREAALRRKLLERKRDKDVEGRRGSKERESRDRSRSREPERHRRRDREDDRRSPGDERRRRHDSPTRNRSPRPRTRSPPPPPRARDDRHDVPPHLQQSDPRDRRDDRRPSPSYNRYQAPPPRREEAFIPLNGNGDGSNNIAKYGYGGGRGDLPGQGPGLGQGVPPPPWRNGGNGIQGGPPGFQAGGARGGGGFIGPADFERRRVERETSTITIWPLSPKQPYRDEEERDADRKAARKAKKSKSSKKSKKRHYSSSDSDTDSEEERRRRRKRKEKERRKKYDSESSDDERARRKQKVKDDNRRKDDHAADQWVEKPGEVAVIPSKPDIHHPTAHPEPLEYSSDEDIGPQLPTEYNTRDKRRGGGAYTNMLKGEGEAMAQFLESGERIPRRGEIGLESEQIEKFEDSGYVMSGNRHKRMTAVRMRKENQVINAEEKRAILNLQREEKMKKEGMIITQFREMMAENLKKQGISEEH